MCPPRPRITTQNVIAPTTAPAPDVVGPVEATSAAAGNPDRRRGLRSLRIQRAASAINQMQGTGAGINIPKVAG